ncbi:hypothetical protein SDC9_177246 [bioreactor metagenome]|uniref:4Fe-4S ferredoxin-type domain-containing protein n=1 Tax=bioreactor metagenome TaxID=1076179 RepID=A0A645H1S7_9ZZZZ
MVDLSRRAFFRGRPRPRTEMRPPWALAEGDFIDRCTRCNDCVSACPTHILLAGDGGYPTIDFRAGECTFCSDCVASCQPQALLRAGRYVRGILVSRKPLSSVDWCLTVSKG